MRRAEAEAKRKELSENAKARIEEFRAEARKKAGEASTPKIKIIGGKEKIIIGKPKNSKNAVTFVDGKEVSLDKLNDVALDDVSRVYILKGDKATEKYGDLGKNGVIEIELKK